MRYGMVIDLSRCVACYACVVACKAEHATPPGCSSRGRSAEKRRVPHTRNVYMPMLCNHCDVPSCVTCVPTGPLTNARKTASSRSTPTSASAAGLYDRLPLSCPLPPG